MNFKNGQVFRVHRDCKTAVFQGKLACSDKLATGFRSVLLERDGCRSPLAAVIEHGQVSRGPVAEPFEVNLLIARSRQGDRLPADLGDALAKWHILPEQGP